MEEEVYEIIDRYLAGETSPEETIVFEERLKNDALFAERVALYKAVSTNLSTRIKKKEERKQLTETISAIGQEYLGHDSTTPTYRKKWYGWAAAASVIFLCAILIYSQLNSTPDYSEYAVYEPLALVERGSADSLQWKAQQAFNFKNYKEAIQYFDRLLQADKNNTQIQLYKGVSLLEENQYREAESIFDSLQNSQSVYKDKAKWFLALSALKQKEYERCEKILREIKPESEEYTKAQELLGEL